MRHFKQNKNNKDIILYINELRMVLKQFYEKYKESETKCFQNFSN